jgi:hypothetical protein
VRAVLKRELGAWADDVAGDPGECARAGPRQVAGKAELTGGSHDAARESGRAAKRFSELTRRAREAEREKGTWARATGADRAAPLGRGRGGGGPRGGGGEETVVDRWSPPIRRRGARAAPLGWTGSVWADLRFSIFLEFLIAFLFYFL